MKYTVNEIVAAAWYGKYTIGQLHTRAKHSTIQGSSNNLGTGTCTMKQENIKKTTLFVETGATRETREGSPADMLKLR